MPYTVFVYQFRFKCAKMQQIIATSVTLMMTMRKFKLQFLLYLCIFEQQTLTNRKT